MAKSPTVRSVETRMAEARQILRNPFLKRHANGRGSDNYVDHGDVLYDLKALKEAAHRPPVPTISFQTDDALAQLTALGFTYVVGIKQPYGLPDYAQAAPRRQPRVRQSPLASRLLAQIPTR